MKQLSFILFTAIAAILSCNAAKTTGDNSETSLDWEGNYTGILPCADCSGMMTRLSLLKDNSYTLTTQYLGKSGSVFTSNGKFEWRPGGGSIVLKDIAEGTGARYYKVGENQLIQLDLQGNAITGALADHYVLKKGETGIENKYWKLVEVNGTAVSTDPNERKEAHFILHASGLRVTGSGGCNNFTGTYQLEANNRIRFSPLAATKMACINAGNTEHEMFKALSTADSYYTSNDSLQLIRARMAPLAKFVAVYLR